MLMQTVMPHSLPDASQFGYMTNGKFIREVSHKFECAFLSHLTSVCLSVCFSLRMSARRAAIARPTCTHAHILACILARTRTNARIKIIIIVIYCLKFSFFK